MYNVDLTMLTLIAYYNNNNYYICINIKVVMELVDMNSLGLFGFNRCPFKSDLPYPGLAL